MEENPKPEGIIRPVPPLNQNSKKFIEADAYKVRRDVLLCILPIISGKQPPHNILKLAQTYTDWILGGKDAS